ncbi:GL25320 [Drosophila persimilis]|uniref:GL25320 n=1 Tax=Drosophila persimilis TaxID=7234 RepID=B4GU38_DROPE|nr:uncharacterized protein LOC6597025 [Drosophila persimilis]EDW26121.1 GL25320 [Drosophila persimilis]
MKRFVIIGLATAVTVPLIYALKKRERRTEVVQAEQEEDEEVAHECEQEPQLVEEDEDEPRMVEYDLVDEEGHPQPQREIGVGEIIVVLCTGFFLSKIFSRGVFYKILMSRLNLVQ